MIGRADILAPIGSLLDAWGIDRLDAPERLPWLLGLTALCLWWAARRPQPALLWPAASQLPARGAGSRRAARWLPLASRAVALGLLALALCDPVALRTLPPESGPGLDVLLVLDASGSMATVDARGTADQPLQRIDVARAAVGRFAAHRIDEGDRVGLVFGAHAFTQCPLTHDAALLGDALGRVEVGVAGDATALGDALALAVRRVERAGGGEGQAVVLLTDGQSNAGDVPVSVALELARAAAVRVYTVAIGRAGNADLRAAVQRAGHGDADAAPPPAREALAELARATGGVAFDATGERDLAAVYAAIDALERAPRPRPARVALDRPSSEALLLGAGLLIFTELGLLRILRRRLPE